MSLLLFVFACATTPSSAPPASADASSASPPEAVKKVVKKQSGQVRYCYESQLKHNPSLAGRMELTFVVEAGQVTKGWVAANTTGDDVLAECVATKVMTWRFTADVSGEFTYPFSLTPAQSTRSEAGRD